MTTLTVDTYSGLPGVEDQRIICPQDADQVVVAADSIDIPILADGLLFVVATLISRLFTRVFGATDCSTGLDDLPDYCFPTDCCCS